MKNAKNKLFFSLILLSFFSFNNLAYAKVEVVLGNIPIDRNPNLAVSAPTNSASEIIISREQYVISYNKVRRSPNWVAWKIEADQIGNSGRSNKFSQDSDLESYLVLTPTNKHAVNETEYRGSCFDRGHQIPSADRTDTAENNQMTFLMSNMTPQTPYLNRVLWVHLEAYTRELVKKHGKTVYVITGPLYDQDFGIIGTNKDIPVPSKAFKVIVVLEPHQTPEDINSKTEIISVIVPNTLQDGTRPMDDIVQLCKPLSTGTRDRNDWLKYKTTLAEVEALSGFKILTLKN